jgi:hypothetical protein
MAAATVPLIIRPLRKVWAREDADLGSRYDPFHCVLALRVLFFVKGLLLLAVYAAALVFYLFSWTKVGPDGIEQRLPWATLNHTFGDILSLEMIPDGERSESLRQNGPCYSVTFKGGRYLSLSADNEGTTHEELRALTAYIADRSGLRWARRADARAR